MLKNVRRCAFTLAEVLITLGIIGVVAALTMPTLIQNHQKQVYVTGLKKAYSNLSNAFSKMAFDEGVTDWKDTYCANYYRRIAGNDKECFDRIVKQFKVIDKKYSGESCSADWCKHFFYSSLSPYYYALGGEEAKFVTADGAVYLFGCFVNIDVPLVDINGSKGPNKFGRDIFQFYIDLDKNKVEPYGIGSEELCTTEAVNNGDYDAGFCTAKVLLEGKMDY